MNIYKMRTMVKKLQIFLLFSGGASLANAQILPDLTDTPSLLTKPHHVTGYVERGRCNYLPEPSKLRIVEYWYVTPTSKLHDLVIPVDPANGKFDPLYFNGRNLQQKRVLGEAPLSFENANFDITWSEVAFPTRIPWTRNIQNGRTGEYTTAYRILMVQAASDQSGYLVKAQNKPELMFYGSETSKYVGMTRIDCVLIGG